MAFLTAVGTDVIDIASAIVDYGVLVIIAAVFLIIVIMYFNTIMKRDSKTVGGIIPKMEELSKNLVEFQRVFNEVLSAHSAHSNQSLKSIERDCKELRETLLSCERSLNRVEGELDILRSNYDTLFKLIVENGNSIPKEQCRYGKIYYRPDLVENVRYEEMTFDDNDNE